MFDKLIGPADAETIARLILDLGVWSAALDPIVYVDVARRAEFDLERCGRPLLADEALLREDPRISGKLRQLMESHRRHMEVALEKIARSRQLRSSVPETARLLSYAVNGAMLAARMENSLEPLEDLRLIVEDVLGCPLRQAPTAS